MSRGEIKKKRGHPAGKWSGTGQLHLVLEGRMQANGVGGEG